MEQNVIPMLATGRLAAAGGVGLSFALTALIFFGHDGSQAAQPIAFNHSKHIQSGLNCPDCHAGVETQARATLPALEFCMNCHAAALTESPEEEKLRTLAEGGGQLSWVRLTKMPAHVYFSHRRHVVSGKLACAGCHGPMEELVAPPTSVFGDHSMDGCIACHEKNQAGTDCNDCHR